MSAGRGAETSIRGSPQPLEELETDEEHEDEELEPPDVEDPEPPTEVK